MEVRNAAPKVTFGATTAVQIKVGQSVSFQGAFTDPGVNDGPWAWRVVWGDNSQSEKGTTTAQGNLGPFVHRYMKAGNYEAYLNVEDKDLKDQSSRRVPITVDP
jgi:PKD repeat protein